MTEGDQDLAVLLKTVEDDRDATVQAMETAEAQRDALARILVVICPSLTVPKFRDGYLVQVLGAEQGQAAIDGLVASGHGGSDADDRE